MKKCVKMPWEKYNILEFNHYMKSDKMAYITYASIKSLIRKTDWCANNPEKSSTTKIGEHIPYGYSMPTIFGCDRIESKHTFYFEKILWKSFAVL